ncbi:MAG TPA: GNAT family N-acetyltransferase [Ktedonobacterales bacterium]|nr:GNAT family N-acetyltransferase [Ktedonobacterales bacterium]
MLTSQTWRRIYGHLSARLGCPAETLRAPGLRVMAHGPWLAGYQGVYVWRMETDGAQASVTASTPEALVDEAQAALAGVGQEAALDSAFWLGALGPRVDLIVGPSYQGYLDGDVFHPAPPDSARALAVDERPALERLARACPAEEWEHSDIQPDHDPIFVVSGEDGALQAAASLTRDGAGLVSVGVITHPAARGRGHGRAVVSAATTWALARGETVHYQTLRANTPSVAIARALGYQDVASALAIRLWGERAQWAARP